MTIETNALPYPLSGIAKQLWTAPQIHILDINAAEGSNPGSLCDKKGSLSASGGTDRCDPTTK